MGTDNVTDDHTSLSDVERRREQLRALISSLREQAQAARVEDAQKELTDLADFFEGELTSLGEK